MKFQDKLLFILDESDLRNLLVAEIAQWAQEGAIIEQGISELVATSNRESMIEIYHKFQVAAQESYLAGSEPISLEMIHATRPAGPRRIGCRLEPDQIDDRIHGGWLGRIAGCVLGKPVEPWGYKQKICDYLQRANRFPLSDYFPLLDPMPDGYSISGIGRSCCSGKTNGAPYDDDTDYSILSLHILETYGAGFTTEDVAREWLGHLAYHNTWTAERAAYRNRILGIPPAECALILNPEREYIGARIRADVYGLVCPGKPELAAQLAYQDAVLSHTKNGVYSAMFMAAMLAWSYATGDVHEIINVGLSEIPANCRLANAVHTTIQSWDRSQDWESVFEHLAQEFGHYHPVHSINNTVLLVLALLASRSDFEKAICIAVMCGLDTDCNAANAGAITGVMTGANNLPAKWTRPLNDTLFSAISLFGEQSISELARRTSSIERQIHFDHL